MGQETNLCRNVQYRMQGSGSLFINKIFTSSCPSSLTPSSDFLCQTSPQIFLSDRMTVYNIFFCFTSSEESLKNSHDYINYSQGKYGFSMLPTLTFYPFWKKKYPSYQTKHKVALQDALQKKMLGMYYNSLFFTIFFFSHTRKVC